MLAKTYSTNEVEKELKEKHYNDLTWANGYKEKLVKLSCDAAQPENKEEWWKKFLDGTELSKDEYVAGMQWFYSSDPQALMTEYSEQWFEHIDTIFATKHRDYAEVFFINLKPISLGRKEDLEQLEKIYSQVDEDRTHFRKLLKMAIEDLEDIIAKRN